MTVDDPDCQNDDSLFSITDDKCYCCTGQSMQLSNGTGDNTDQQSLIVKYTLNTDTADKVSTGSKTSTAGPEYTPTADEYLTTLLSQLGLGIALFGVSFICESSLEFVIKTVWALPVLLVGSVAGVFFQPSYEDQIASLTDESTANDSSETFFLDLNDLREWLLWVQYTIAPQYDANDTFQAAVFYFISLPVIWAFLVAFAPFGGIVMPVVIMINFADPNYFVKQAPTDSMDIQSVAQYGLGTFIAQVWQLQKLMFGEQEFMYRSDAVSGCTSDDKSLTSSSETNNSEMIQHLELDSDILIYVYLISLAPFVYSVLNLQVMAPWLLISLLTHGVLEATTLGNPNPKHTWEDYEGRFGNKCDNSNVNPKPDEPEVKPEPEEPEGPEEPEESEEDKADKIDKGGITDILKYAPKWKKYNFRNEKNAVYVTQMKSQTEGGGTIVNDMTPLQGMITEQKSYGLFKINWLKDIPSDEDLHLYDIDLLLTDENSKEALTKLQNDNYEFQKCCYQPSFDAAEGDSSNTFYKDMLTGFGRVVNYTKKDLPDKLQVDLIFSIYEGEIKKGRPQGFGRIMSLIEYPKMDTFIGYLNGQLETSNGTGQYIFDFKVKYQGYYDDGQSYFDDPPISEYEVTKFSRENSE